MEPGSALPARARCPANEIASGVPVLSLTLDEADLNDPGDGPLAEQDEARRGMGTRRQRLLLRGRQAAVRVGRRRPHSRRKQPASWRHARVSDCTSGGSTGRASCRLGLLFSPEAQPIRRLVVHDDVRRMRGVHWHFVNPLAYDIARAMGAIAPETKPVRFFVNGEYYGPFVLTERFDERFFAAHWGYDDILLSQEEMNKLWDWVRTTRPLTMENVSQHVNIENLTRWFLAVAFSCDARRVSGPGTISGSKRKRPGGWFWVNWDMDQSFRDWNLDSYQYLLERVGEARRGRNRAEPRSVIC